MFCASDMDCQFTFITKYQLLIILCVGNIFTTAGESVTLES